MSKLETMAYKMQPAGHEEPAPKRNYGKSDKRLCTAFEKWLQQHGKIVMADYNLAVKLTEGIMPSLDEIHSLLIRYQDNDIIDAGDFISAMYNKIPEKIIVFDVKQPLRFLGNNLRKDKTVINYGTLEEGFCEAKGTVINYGHIGGIFSDCPVINYNKIERIDADRIGPIINLGTIERLMQHSANGPFINLGVCNMYVQGEENEILRTFYKLKLVRRNKGPEIILTEDEYNKYPDLMNYFSELKVSFEKGRNDHNAAITAFKEFGEEPAKHIQKEILRRLGHNV